jgi:hypothetical protein
MRVKIHASALRGTRWYQYAVRFFFGGTVTAIAGLIAKKFGPGVGGLFLAFPAILPASATLIEKHEKERKERAGLKSEKRGREAASIDAAGASMGAIGLFVFAVMVWRLVDTHTPWLVVTGASAAWLITSILAWRIRKAI